MPIQKQSIDMLKKAADDLGYKTVFLEQNGAAKRLLISNGSKLYITNSTRFGFYPEVQRWQQHLCDSKIITQEVLELLGYTTIASFTAQYKNYASVEDLCTSVKKHVRMYPVLIKPANGARGMDITIAEDALSLRAIVTKLYGQKKSLLIQPIITSPEYRILIVNGEVEVVHLKQMNYITGDGVHTLRELLSNKKKQEQDEPFIKQQLAKRKLNKDSVLPKGEKFLCHLTRFSSPGEYYESKNIAKPVIAWAKKLSSDVSMHTIGIDVFAPNGLEDPQSFIVIELNANPAFEYLERRYNDSEKMEHILRSILNHYFNS